MTTLGMRVVVIIETLLGPVLNSIGVLATITFSIPVIGVPIFRLVTAVHHGIASLFLFPELLLQLCGVVPEKRLRMRIVIPRDERGQPICQSADVLPALQVALDVFYQRANVRILPIGPFVFTTNGAPTANDGYLCIEPSKAKRHLLDCEASHRKLFGRISYNAKVCRYCFWANWRRMIGYGSPICVFAVRSIKTTFTVEAGECVGLAPRGLIDFVLVDFTRHVGITKRSFRMAHELGHACLLKHSLDPNNLMHLVSRESGTLPALTPKQVFMLRLSPHVTYF